MRAHTAFAVYVSLCLATTARGDVKWIDIHEQGLTAFRSQNLEIAEPLFRKSVELARRSDEVGASANDLGVVLHMRGRDLEAKQWLERAVAAWQLNGSVESTASSSHSLGSVHRALGNYPEAEKILRAALATHPQNKVTVAMIHNLLGDLLRETGHLEEARSSAMFTRETPGLPWRISADADIIIADVDRETGQLAPSIASWNKLIGEARDHGDSNIEAVTLRGLGETQFVAGDRAAAEPTLRKALAIFETANVGHQVAATLTSLGELYIDEQKPAMAEEVLRRAVDLDEKAMGPTHPQIAVLLQMRADAASRQGALPRARADLDRAWAILVGRFGPRSPVAGAYLANRGIIEQRAGNNEGALANYEQAVDILRASGPEVLKIKASMMERYAEVLKTMHQKDKAKAILAEVKSFRQ